jgi:hypothetical protein
VWWQKTFSTWLESELVINVMIKYIDRVYRKKNREIKLSYMSETESRVHGGFSEGDLMDECIKFFQNGTVKLTIEFVDTHVMQIQRDIRKCSSRL